MAASQPRLSETDTKLFVFETSCYAFGGWICRFAKVNVNKVNIFLLYHINSRCKLFLSMYTFIILTIRFSALCNSVNGWPKRTKVKEVKCQWCDLPYIDVIQCIMERTAFVCKQFRMRLLLLTAETANWQIAARHTDNERNQFDLLRELYSFITCYRERQFTFYVGSWIIVRCRTCCLWQGATGSLGAYSKMLSISILGSENCQSISFDNQPAQC